jgi:nucleotide-binding universal stress UspA family protein
MNMATKIMVTLDGSPFAERALEFATDLAQQRQAEICLVQVAPLESRMAEGEEYLKSKAEQLEKNHVKCSTKVFLGSAPETIVEQSAKFDLIVMTSHGHSQFDQLILGSVAEKVVRKSNCPVLVLRDRQIRLREIKRVLVPLDGFDLSLKAIPEATRVCLATGATMVLGRVNEAVGIELGLVSRDDESRRMEDYLQEIAKTVDSSITVETAHEFGSAARSLLRLVDKENIDLVVMTSHGRGGFNRWVCGSVAENLLRLSLAPILLVRADMDNLKNKSEN